MKILSTSTSTCRANNYGHDYSHINGRNQEQWGSVTNESYLHQERACDKPWTGTAAVLIKAKRAGEVAAVKPLLEKLLRHGYRLSPSLTKEVITHCGE